MRKTWVTSLAIAAALGIGSIGTPGTVHAGNFFDIMNPTKWFGGDRDDDYRYYRYRRQRDLDYWRWNSPWAWGYPPPGLGAPMMAANPSSNQAPPPKLPE